jgi:hypothetical protein
MNGYDIIVGQIIDNKRTPKGIGYYIIDNFQVTVALSNSHFITFKILLIPQIC